MSTGAHTGTAAGANAGTTSGANAGETFGEKIRDGGNVIKGAGDALRGEINSFIDNVGEGIAGRSKDERPPTVTDGGRRPEEVAKEGEARLEKGLNGLDRQ